MLAVRGIPRNRFGAEQPDRARHVDEEWRRTVEHFVRRAGLGRRPGLDRASGSPGAPLGAGVVLRSSPTLWLGVPLASIRNSRSRGHIHIAHGRIREPLPEGALDVPAGSWARPIAVTFGPTSVGGSDEVRADGHGAAARARCPGVE